MTQDGATDRPTAPGPTRADERAPGPDLARGAMLLFIALANSHYFLRGDRVLGGFPLDGSAVDSAVAWLLSTFVDGRAFPMFGLLFGYGVARIAARQQARGPQGVRRLLRRRAAVLVMVGLAHAVLLFAGDILTAYGVLLLVGAWAVRWPDRRLLMLAAFFLALMALPGETLASSTEGPDASMLPPDLPTMLTARPPVSLFVALVGPLGFACPFALGLWAGRRRLLEEPERHRTLLRVVAAGGIGVAALGAQPLALAVAGLRPVPDAAALSWLGPLHDATGYLGGAGWAAAFTLLSVRLTRRGPGPFTAAVLATGRRSMTCYLAQSPVWAVVFTPFLLDLSGTLTVSTTALLAVGTWASTVLLAGRLEGAGRRGPFETLTRRVTYGRAASREVTVGNS